MRSPKWKSRAFLSLLIATVSVSSLCVVILWQSSFGSPHEAGVVLCTVLQEDEPVANVSITLEIVANEGNRITISEVSESDGSITAELPTSLEAPVRLEKVTLSGKWAIQTVAGDRIYDLSEREWALTDSEAFLEGHSSYHFEDVQLQPSLSEGRLSFSLKLHVLSARLVAVHNSPSGPSWISLLVGRSLGRFGQYVGFELEETNFVPVNDSSLAVIPLGQPLRLIVLAEVFDFSWRLNIEVDVSDRDFIDLSGPAVRAMSRAQVQQLSNALDVLAAEGFNVAEQHEKLSEIRGYYEKAALAMESRDYSGGFELMLAAWGQCTQIHYSIREIYTQTLPWTVSVTLMLAFFSVTVSFLVSERQRVRNLIMPTLLISFLLVFMYMQPSLRLFVIGLTGIAEKLDVHLLASLIQMLPWFTVAVALFAYPRFRDLLWETFGVTVRNMRRRKLRTLLTLSTIIVVSTSAMCLLSITPHVPSNRVPLSGLEPAVSNGIVVSRYEVLTPRPTAGEQAAKGDSYPLPVPASGATWIMDQPCVARANIYGLKEVSISNSSGQSLPDFSVFYLAIVEPSFIGEYCASDSSDELWLTQYEESSVLIGSRIAEAYNIQIGDNVIIDDRSFKVMGIFDEDRRVNEWKEIDGGNLFFGIYDPIAGSLTGESFLIGSVSDFPLESVSIYKVSLILSDVTELDGFVESLLQKGYSHEVNPLYDITRTYFIHVVEDGAVTSAYYGTSRFALVGPWHSQIVMIALSAMMIFINVFASVNERKSDILAMHVVGASPLRIRLVFIAEALVIGLMGGIYGYVIGYLFAGLANSVYPGVIQASLSGSMPFIVSVSTSVLSSVLGSVFPSKTAILTVVPSRRMLKRSADIFTMKKENADIDLPMRIHRNELASFDSFLERLADRFPSVRYGYDGLSVLDLVKKEEQDRLTHTIEVNYAAERSLYYKVTISVMKSGEPQRINIAVYPLDPWERKVIHWSREHASLLPRLAACLRNELLQYASWKRGLTEVSGKSVI